MDALIFIYLLLFTSKFCVSYRYNNNNNNNQLVTVNRHNSHHFIGHGHRIATTTTRSIPSNNVHVNNDGHKLRHNYSRFPRLDNLIQFMNHMETTTTTSRTIKSVKSRTSMKNNRRGNSYGGRYNKLFAHGDDSLSEYEDIVDDDEKEGDPNEYGDLNELESDYDDDDEQDDDDTDENDEDNWQAEQSKKQDDTNQISSVTKFKWEMYGTAQRVAQTRENYLKGGTNQQLKKEAEMHWKRMSIEAVCLVPRPRVVSVQTIYPDISRRYIPSCTILHQCSQDTGCCEDDFVCSPKHKKQVQLYFHILDIKNKSTIQKLEFDNHTECECKRTIDSSEQDLQIDGTNSGNSDTGTANLIIATSNEKSRRDISDDYEDFQLSSPEAIKACKCPSDYTPELSFGDNCRCVCKNDECNQRNVGKEHFSLKDRTCIQFNECNEPHCAHGSYIFTSGLCPKKEDKLKMYASSNNNHTRRKQRVITNTNRFNY